MQKNNSLKNNELLMLNVNSEGFEHLLNNDLKKAIYGKYRKVVYLYVQ